MKINNIINKLEKQYNKKLAYDFDNPGLNVGDGNENITGILVCLDVTNDAIDFAIKNKINLIISHHPMLFYKIANVNANRTDTKKVLKLLENKISCYSMHTNFDVKSKIGMGDIVCEKLFSKNEIKKVKYIENVDNNNGLGSIVELSKKISIDDLVNKISKNFEINKNMIRIYTKENCEKKYINNIAILPGSGKSDVDTIIDKKVQTYISGDLAHNNILDLLDNDINYIDCTHYGLEKIFVDFMYKKLLKEYKNLKIYKYYNSYL